jgi:hypothetical protein
VIKLNFIYVFDEPTKDELIKNGYDFMRETNYKNKKAYLFVNNGNKVNFTNKNIEYSNKLYC